jgi:hypothetical protein
MERRNPRLRPDESTIRMLDAKAPTGLYALKFTV